MTGPINERLPQLQWPTVGLMVLVGGLLTWLNLRVNRVATDFGMDQLPELDAVNQYFFYRGWPLSPCQICPIRSMRFRPDEGFPVGLSLVVDVVAAILILLGVASLCERLVRGVRRVRP